HTGVRAIHRDISFHNVMVRPAALPCSPQCVWHHGDSDRDRPQFFWMDAVLIDCNTSIPVERNIVPTGHCGTPGFIPARASADSDGPTDKFHSRASDVFSAGVFIACLFQYVMLGDHRSARWRSEQLRISRMSLQEIIGRQVSE